MKVGYYNLLEEFWAEGPSTYAKIINLESKRKECLAKRIFDKDYKKILEYLEVNDRKFTRSALSIRSQNGLATIGVYTFYELSQTSPWQILRIRYVGASSLVEMFDHIQRRGERYFTDAAEASKI